jgi:cysteine desulfurase/selenocysteine lyase
MRGSPEVQVKGVRAAPRPLEVPRIRKDFPILEETIRGKKLVYLDNAATTQKPRPVLEAMDRLYAHDYSNVHRGVHALSERATKAYEDARETVRRFLNARSTSEIVWTSGTTGGINLVAQSYGRRHVRAGDDVLISAMEHHSNIVPWQLLCEEAHASLRVVPMSDSGELLMEEFERLLGPRTRIVAVTYVSNALGTVNPVGEIVEKAHAKGIPVLVDAAQAVAHLPVDVQALGCDFFAFSGHKVYGPTGTGVLYGREDLLESMPPYQGGGDMIRSVTFEKTIFNKLPYKFEAGTPNIVGAVGLGAALEYLNGLGLEAVGPYEDELLAYATEAIRRIARVRLIGTARRKCGVLSFVVDGIHPHDVGTVLDLEGIAVRAGHHCAQPVMQRFDVPATTRASFAFYNTREEIDRLVEGVHKVIEVFD